MIPIQLMKTHLSQQSIMFVIENLQNKIYFGKATRADITRVTRRLGDEINKVYNIDLPFAREKKPREIER